MFDDLLSKSGDQDISEFPRIQEYWLLCAMLRRAVLDLLGSDRKLAREAEEWLFCSDTPVPPPPFSLNWICEELDLQAHEVRDVIRRKQVTGTLEACAP